MLLNCHDSSTLLYATLHNMVVLHLAVGLSLVYGCPEG